MLVLLAALYWAIIHQRGLRFVRTLCVAWEHRWCEYDYPGGTGTTLQNTLSHPRARRTGFSHRVGAFSLLGSGRFALPRPDALSPLSPKHPLCAHNTLRVSIVRLEHLTLSGRGCLGFVYTDSQPIVHSILTTLVVIRKCTDSVPIWPCVERGEYFS
jgi:hypothetical protein